MSLPGRIVSLMLMAVIGYFVYTAAAGNFNSLFDALPPMYDLPVR